MKYDVGQLAASYMQLIPKLYRVMDKPDDGTGGDRKGTSDITHLQVHILEELYQHPEGIAMTPLSRIIRVSMQQMTPLIAKLEEKGYLVKQPGERDKRLVRLRLADKGKALVGERWGGFHAALSRKLERLNPEDQGDLAYAMDKLTRILTRLPS